jgi:hypothetical protein
MSRKQALVIESIGAVDRAHSPRHSRYEAVAAEAGTLTRVPDPTRSAAPLARAPESGVWCGAGRAGRASCGGAEAVAVAVAVVTGRRPGTRVRKPCAASTRHIDTPAQPGDRRESERSERPGEQDCRAGALAQRTRLMLLQSWGWSR